MDWNTRVTDVGPYTMVRRDERKAFEVPERTFRLVLYGAYNAYGLIGPEINGIAILDEDFMQVLCDNIEQEDSGYYGATSKQKATYDKLMAMSWSEFKKFVNGHKRTRYPI